MLALWLEDRKLALREVPRPRPADGEALVRVRVAGVCSTDLELIRGYYPYTGIPGHEFVGVVVETADPAWLGRRVVGEINASCGGCPQCAGGRPSHCERRTVLGIVGRNGALAEYTTLPVSNLHPVPDSVPDEAAVFTEPLAAALQIREQIQIRPDDRVLLVGAGRLGQLVAQSLATVGCDLRVLVKHARQRELLGARGIPTLAEEEALSGRWDIVIEATGSPSGFSLARRAIRPRGTLVLKSTYAGTLNVDFSSLVVDEITIVGSRCGPFGPALRLLESRQVDTTALVAAAFPLAAALQAFDHAAQPGALKVLIRP